MSKKYVEAWPSELGTTLGPNWTWFPATHSGETWYTNGHVAMSVIPVRRWPAEPPKGLRGGRAYHYFQNPPAIPIDPEQLDMTDNPLLVTGYTEREGKTVISADYSPGVVYLMDDEGTVHHVARHYHYLVMKKFPRAFPFGDVPNKPIVYREKDGKLVAILMPIRH